jgi:hypothetical protein
MKPLFGRQDENRKGVEVGGTAPVSTYLVTGTKKQKHLACRGYIRFPLRTIYLQKTSFMPLGICRFPIRSHLLSLFKYPAASPRLEAPTKPPREGGGGN